APIPRIRAIARRTLRDGHHHPTNRARERVAGSCWHELSLDKSSSIETIDLEIAFPEGGSIVIVVSCTCRFLMEAPFRRLIICIRSRSQVADRESSGYDQEYGQNVASEHFTEH